MIKSSIVLGTHIIQLTKIGKKSEEELILNFLILNITIKSRKTELKSRKAKWQLIKDNKKNKVNLFNELFFFLIPNLIR
tara:strand:- start:2764 stop:3000 length:237 start_codon:yes stop_codon:yes gene_type:complete